MLNPMEWADLDVRIKLMRQEYRAALLEIESAPDLTEIERVRLGRKLLEEYMLRRTQERQVIHAQVAEDAQVGLKRIQSFGD